MKKVLYSVILLITAFNLIFINKFFTLKTASANTIEYYRVLNENTYIYSNSLLTDKIFEVPNTYYVKVESVTQSYARVSYGYDDFNYPVIMGYMKLEELTPCETIPSNPFSIIKISTSMSDILFNDSELKSAYFNVPSETFMTYYGNFTNQNGTKLCYVYCNNKLGYIDVNSINSFSVPKNTDPIIVEGEETPPPQDEVTPETPSSLKGESLQIIIIVGISIVSISIVYALFKPSKNKIYKKQPISYEDEE